MEATGYLRVLRRHLVLILIVTLLGTGIAAVVALVTPPTYQAQATLFLRVQSSGTLLERSQFALQRVRSYPQLLQSPTLLRRVIDENRLRTTPQQLAKRLSATNPDDTVLLTVTATAPQPGEAALIANSAARLLAESVNDLERSASKVPNAVTLRQQIAAQPSTTPVSPNRPVLIGLGVLAGLVLGCLGALVAEAVRPRMRSVAEVRRATGLPVVAELPWSQLGSGSALRATTAAYTAAANLRALGRGALPPILLLAPADRVSGRPPVRYLLARGLAETGRSVALVETDASAALPRGVHLPFGAPGLSEVLARRADLDEVVLSDAAPPMNLVPVGDTRVAPSSFEVERRMGDVLVEIAASHDTTVLQGDAAGFPAALDAVGPVARGALVVVSRRATSPAAARRTINHLRVLGVVPIGVLVVDAPATRHEDLLSTWREEDFIVVAAGSGRRAALAAERTATAEPDERRYPAFAGIDAR